MLDISKKIFDPRQSSDGDKHFHFHYIQKKKARPRYLSYQSDEKEGKRTNLPLNQKTKIKSSKKRFRSINKWR